MKKRLYSVIFIILLVIGLSQFVLARKGVGMVWTTETEIVNEGASKCISYGIYNPWDEDVTATLDVSDELKPILLKIDSKPQFIKGETFHDAAVLTEFCFKVARVYSRDCLIGNMLCEQTCSETPIEYSGSVIALEEQSGEASGTGSATSLGVVVPLKIKVACNESSRNYTPVYIIIIVIALGLIAWILYRNKNANKAQSFN